MREGEGRDGGADGALKIKLRVPFEQRHEAAPRLAVRGLQCQMARAVQRDPQQWNTEREVLRQLPRLAGDDVTPIAPWETEAYFGAESRRHIAATWLRWWREHGRDTPAQRAAAGEAHALADLSSDDAARRYEVRVHADDRVAADGSGAR